MNLTLIFIPVLYSLFNGAAERRKNKKEARRLRRIEAEEARKLKQEGKKEQA